MFDATRGRSRWGLWVLAAVLAVGAAGVAWLGHPAERALVAMGGGNPLASPFAAEHPDQTYPESPLAVSLTLEQAFGPVDRDGVLAWADGLAAEVGFWALSATGADDIESAEKALWDQDRLDELANAWARGMQARELHSREKQGRLSIGVPEHGPRYLQPEEVVLLLAHVAWRLDLGAVVIRSPVHWYVELRQPGGAGKRGIEATCFWRVDALGKLAPSDEPSVGRRLTFPPEHYPSGAGGIRNPVPLPPGTYEPVSAADLTGLLLGKLGERYEADPTALEAKLAEAPNAGLAQTVFRQRLAAGLAAWDRGDLDAVRRHAKGLEDLRAKYPELLPPDPDEKVLTAIVKFADGAKAEGLDLVHAVIAFHEPNGPVLYAKTDAHAAAMWLELEHGRASLVDWNARVVPLLNRHKDQPERMAKLCAIGRKVLADTNTPLEQLVPECAAAKATP